jgi:hypothetical protein
MKTVKHTASDLFADLKSTESQQFLKHLLSPLERAALKNNYRPFTYIVDGARIFVNLIACKNLLKITRHKLCFFTGLLEEEILQAKKRLHQAS